MKHIDFEHVTKLIDQNNEQIHRLLQIKVEIWTQYVLFTGRWWLGVCLSLIPWIIWLIFRKKDSTDRIFYGGLLVIGVSLALDILGDQYSFWHYRFNV